MKKYLKTFLLLNTFLLASFSIQAQTAMTFDSSSQNWLGNLSNAPEIPTNLPNFIKPGTAVYVHLSEPAELEIPDPKLRIRFYHQDHLGSSAVVTDSVGQIVEETEFYPYGYPRNSFQPKGVVEPYKYTQKELDAESNLEYCEARYYSSVLARFISIDPAGDDLNLYSYAKNNPIIYSDPLGLSSKKDNNIFDDFVTSTFQDWQSKINGLEYKAKHNIQFTAKDRDFLKFIYHTIAFGGTMKGYNEASNLLDNYLNKKGQKEKSPLLIKSDVYKTSQAVKSAMAKIKTTILKDLTDGVLSNPVIVARNLKAEETNPRLKNVDNRFDLSAKVTLLKNGDLSITWSVTSFYDFEPYSSGKNYYSEFPLDKPKGQLLKIDDGLTDHLTKIGLAEKFWYKAEWKEIIAPNK